MSIVCREEDDAKGYNYNEIKKDIRNSVSNNLSKRLQLPLKINLPY